MKPSSLERHLRVESLESRQMMTGVALSAVQQDTAYLTDAVLRGEPVELLAGAKEFNGSTMECIPDSPIFTGGSFALETAIRVNAIRQQSIITKYDSGADDRSFHLCMLNDGRLQIDVYGVPSAQNYLTFRTTGTPLHVGQWQTLRASFDLEHRELALMVDGQDVPGETIKTGSDVTTISDGSTAMRVGGRRTGGGDGNYLSAGVQYARFIPIASFKEHAQATDAAIAEGVDTPSTADAAIAVEEQPSSEANIAEGRQRTEASINAVLRAEPITLLNGTKEFDGSTVVEIPDSPVFTDGSFLIEANVRLNAIKGQTLVSKYNSQSEAGPSFYLGMYPDGRLEFVVYGKPGTKSRMILETNAAPLTVGQWHTVQARFDVQNQTLSIMVDGQEVPSTIVAGFDPVPALYDSTSPVRVAGSVFGSGLQDFSHSTMRDVIFYPVQSFDAAAVDAVLADGVDTPSSADAAIAVEEPPSSEANVAEGQQRTEASIGAVLRSEPITLLSGTKEFNGSQMESVADNVLFTSGSFVTEGMVRVDVIRSQTIFSKYDSRVGDKSFFAGMNGQGCLEFDVYGDNGTSRTIVTNSAPLIVGTWHKLRVSFDAQSQKMSILVDDKEVPSTLMEGSQEVKTLHDGTCPVDLAASRFGNGPANYADIGLANWKYYSVESFGIPEEETTNAAVASEETAEVEAVLPLTEEEAQETSGASAADTTAATTTETGTEKELTAEMVQTVLIDLLSAQDAAEAPRTLSDTPDLSGATLRDGVLSLDLPSLGGNATITSWQGHAKGYGVKTITGEEGRQAAIAVGVIAEERTIDTTPALTDVLDLPDGIQTDANGIHHTVHVDTAELGKVCVCVDDGRKAISLAQRDGYVAGEGSGYLFGQAGLSLEFEDGPRYVQWIDLKRLSGSTSVKVYAWDAKGTVRTLWASESGRLAINDTVRIMATYPEQSKSSWVINAINTDPIIPPPAFEETWMQASGELVGIDLSGAETAVQSVNFTVRSTNPANTIQAIAYRGDERIAMQTVGTDGAAHFEDAAGITSVLLAQSDPAATLYVTSLSAGGTEGMAAPAGADLSPMSNADVGRYSQKQWEHGTFNYGDIEEDLGILRQRGGYENHVYGYASFSLGANAGDQYGRYDIIRTSGNVSIAGLSYVDQDGLHSVPQEYWTVVGNCLIVAPGCPHYLVVHLSGNGTFDMGTCMGERATDVMPSQKMELRSTVLVVRKVGPAEGFCAVPAGVSSENEHARAGGMVNVFFAIMNDGLGGGPVTVKIHLGQSGTVSDPVVREFTGDIRGLSTIGLSVNVTLGEDNDTAIMEVTGANGESTIVGKQVQPPRIAGTRTREDVEPIILAKARALTIAYWQGRLSDASSEEESDNARQKLAALGISDGVSGGIASTTDALTEKEKVLVAMVGGKLFPDLGWADLKTVEEMKAEKNISDFLSSHAQELRTKLAETFAEHGKTTQEAEQAYQWLMGHPGEIAAYQALYSQSDILDAMFATLCNKMASGVVSIRSISLQPVTEEGYVITNGNSKAYEYLEHAIDLTTPGIRLIGHPVAYGVETPFWHSSLLLVPEHPDRFANLGLTDEAGNPIFVNGQGWVTLGVTGESGFDQSNFTFGKAISDYNRSFDDPIYMPNTFLADIALPQGMTVDDLIERIIRADMRYKDDANYDMFPSSVQWKPISGYNCNSFTTAMLLEAGVPLPSINKLRIFPAYGEMPLPIPTE